MNTPQPPTIMQHSQNGATPGVTSSNTVEAQRARGYLLGKEAIERAGLTSKNKNNGGSTMLYKLRDSGKLHAQLIDGNWYFPVAELDAYKNGTLLWASPPAPEALVATPTAVLPPVARMRGIPAESPAQEDDDELDYAAVYSHVQMLALNLLKKSGIARFVAMSISEVKLQEIPLLWQVKVLQRMGEGDTQAKVVRVRLEGGEYHAESSALVESLQEQVQHLKNDLAYAEQRAQVAVIRHTTKHEKLRGWKDPELAVAIDIVQMDETQVLVSSPDFPVAALGPDQSKATAYYRMALRGWLCALARHAEDDLSIPQQAQLEHLQLLFDEI